MLICTLLQISKKVLILDKKKLRKKLFTIKKLTMKRKLYNFPNLLQFQSYNSTLQVNR